MPLGVDLNVSHCVLIQILGAVLGSGQSGDYAEVGADHIGRLKPVASGSLTVNQVLKWGTGRTSTSHKRAEWAWVILLRYNPKPAYFARMGVWQIWLLRRTENP